MRVDGSEHTFGRRRAFDLKAFALQQKTQRRKDVSLIVSD
jgi:hypothetical protein